MPSTSEAEKTKMCIAYGYKRHGASAIKSVKDKAAVIKMANSMTEEELKDYCLQPVKE